MGKENSFKFTPSVLETIIEKNLTLDSYYKYLYPILQRMADEQDTSSKKEIKVGRDIVRKTMLSLLPTFPQISGTNLFLFEEEAFDYKMIEEALDSKEFIEQLHPYMNSLLTTTNIGIVKETLKIYMLLETNE